MKTLNILIAVMASATMLAAVACSSTPADTAKASITTDLSKANVIPKPVSVTPAGGSFTLSPRTDIFVKGDSPDILQVGQYLADRINPATGFALEVKKTDKDLVRGKILLALTENDPELGEEGYQLVIDEKSVRLTANKPAGLFYGVQTLRQLLPAEIEMTTLQEGPWEMATGTIRDYPSYGYRGAMRDVARHFFGVEDIKIFIDQLATYKMNVLHMHLSDDQGWRIEIKSWPNLTAHGGRTEVGGGEGGFYTQEQYSEIVKYAQERFITVIPEIDMPGHTNSALASYPELNAKGSDTAMYTGTDVGFSSLATDKEITYKFVGDVVRELSALTPGPWFHIGGDESHSTKLEDYIPFVNRVQDTVAAYGKQVLGWDEIALSTLRPNSAVQYWAKAANAIKGVAQGAKVLMSPSAHAYIDMQYDSTSIFGLHWAAYIEVDDAYNWDPASLVPEIKKENILGIEAPLWAETIAVRAEAEYLLFPRLPGYAEIGWTPAELRSWEEYKVRLANHGPRFTAMGISFYPSARVEWVK